MNRFRIVLAFVFLLSATVFLTTYVALQAGMGPSPSEPRLILWDVLSNDGIYLAIVLVLLGMGWAYFGQIFTAPSLTESAQPTP